MKLLTDTHAHIYVEEFDGDRPDMLARARASDVGKIYMPNIDVASIDAMMETELRNPDFCIAMMGLHPCSVKRGFEKELYTMEDWLRKRTFAAIGEMGTDLYWDKSFWDQQKEAFLIQVKWAKEYNLPIVIHCRESIDETIELLEPFVEKEFTGIFHCFTGSESQAKRIIDLGFYLGIGGVATYKNGGLDKVLPQVPLGRIVLETDSPYLAPVPNRGKRNEPAHIAMIAERVAAIFGVTLDEIKQATTRNAAAVFRDRSSKDS